MSTIEMLSNITNVRTATTSQSQPIPGRGSIMVKNNQGGYVFETAEKALLERFLILGSVQGSYYVTGQDLTTASMKDLEKILLSNGDMFVRTVVEVSKGARASNNDYALLALALAISKGNEDTKQYAARSLVEVARTGTHLFHFVKFALGFRGWGKLLKWAVKNWYVVKSTGDLAYQMVKYQSRDGWSHRDILRLTHQNVAHDTERNNLFKWTVKGVGAIENTNGLPTIIQAFEEAKTASKARLVTLIQDHRLSHEMIPNEMKCHPEVWEAMAQHMGATALVRNLNKMTSIGLIKPLSEFSKFVVKRLTTEEFLHKGKIHPIQMLIAMNQYCKGKGELGSMTWAPEQNVQAALQDGFYLSFKTIEPSGKNYLLGLDVSNSMKGNFCVGASSITSAEAACVMAMVTARKEPWCHMIGFDTKIRDINISKDDRLPTVMEKVYKGTFGGTDCAQPMLYAKANKLDVDMFVTYTDNETRHGSVHPTQALRDYRKVMDKPDAKNVVCAMALNRFSIADPSDRNSLDVCGFDSNTPAVISEFSRMAV